MVRVVQIRGEADQNTPHIIRPSRQPHSVPVVKPSAVPTDQRRSERSQPTTVLSVLHQRSAGPGKPAEKKSGS